MDLTSVLGLLLGFGAVLGGQVLEGGSIMAIVQPTAFLIVFVGSVGATMLTFPESDLKVGLSKVPEAFQADHHNAKEVMELILSLATKARKEGILALQKDISTIHDPFLKKGMELMSDGMDPQLLRDILETDIGVEEELYGQAAKVWESTGGYTPTVGILGAVLGLIHVMENLNDPSKLGSGIAVAFVATVYGVGFANLIFIPLGSKIKFKGKHHAHMKTMMVEGIMAIQAGESPNFIQEKLKVYYPGALPEPQR
ncbi:MAG: flagellar motor protein [Vampirovibrionales bacterium]